MIASVSVSILVQAAVVAATPAGTQPADARLGPASNTNTVFAPVHYTEPQWQQRRDWLRDQVRLAAGMFPELPRGPLNARIFGKLVRDGYTIEKVCFTSSPGIYVTGNLYRPLNPTDKCPVIACPHGHWTNGRLHHDEVSSVPARCITLARLGAIVFAYDMVGYNDDAAKIKHGDKTLDSPTTALWGIGHLQIQTFNSSRVIDFLLSLPNADPTRAGVTGASGGATQVFVLAAVDDRITACAPVNMISSTMQGGCVCENAPVLRIDTNNMEIAALFAPKPMLVVSASGDWTKLTPDVEFPFIQSIYKLYTAQDLVTNAHIQAKHNYNLASREAVYRFFGRHLLNQSDPALLKEGNIPVERPKDMLVYSHPGDVPADQPTSEQLIERKKAEIVKSLEPYRPADKTKFDKLHAMVRTALERAVGDNWDCLLKTQVTITSTTNAGRYLAHDGFISRDGRLIPFVLLTHATRVPSACTILVDPDGRDAIHKHQGFIDTLIAADHRVIVIEPFGSKPDNRHPKSVQANERPSGFYITFNRSDAAEMVRDTMLATMAAVHNEYVHNPLEISDSSQVNLVGFGRMGPVCLLARAMLPGSVLGKNRVRLIADMNAFDAENDSAYLQDLFVPYIRRIGGLPVIAAACANGSIWLHNTADKLDTRWLEQAAAALGADPKVDQKAVDSQLISQWIVDADK